MSTSHILFCHFTSQNLSSKIKPAALRSNMLPICISFLCQRRQKPAALRSNMLPICISFLCQRRQAAEGTALDSHHQKQEQGSNSQSESLLAMLPPHLPTSTTTACSAHSAARLSPRAAEIHSSVLLPPQCWQSHSLQGCPGSTWPHSSSAAGPVHGCFHSC